MANKREEGQEGEERAVETLSRNGYRIIERNYRNFFGEIDIIAEEGGYLVFVEVKKRNSSSFGGSLLAVDRKKQQHIIRSATYYLKDHKYFDKKVRFDVVGIDRENIKIVKYAFIVDLGF
ncbi:MAG TPA: YraN family protein [Syntrophorhabdaceae bacterium]